MTDIAITPLITKQVSSFSRPIFETLHKTGLKRIQKIEVDFNFCFTEYLKRNFERCSKTKTLLYRDQPVELREFYVRTDLSKNGRFSSERVEECDFLEIIKQEQRIVISGTAGSGKSTFCKSIFLDLIEQKNDIIPLFIELRYLNSEESLGITEYICHELSKFKNSFNQEQFEYALSSGKILLILDGFDEVSKEKKKVIEDEINDIARQYQKIMILCSSRPDDRFISWEEFYTYSVLPLDKLKAVALIKKIRFDPDIKARFLESLENGLYEKHQSFASNPLLITMMLLTYEQIAEIPEKIHLFYQEAFATLFHKHDAFKSSYRRKTYTGLSIDDFIKLLSTFCLITYSKDKYSFSKKELHSFIDHSKKISKIEVKNESLISDLLLSVCMLQKEGLEYTFTHRSFQEYFAALFLINCSYENKFELFEKIAFSNRADKVLPMAFEMNQDLVEREWLIPKLEWFTKHFTFEENSPEAYLLNLSLIFEDMFLCDDEGPIDAEITDEDVIDVETISSLGIGFTFNRSDLATCYLFMEDFYEPSRREYIGKISWSNEEKIYREKLIRYLMREQASTFHPELLDNAVKEIVIKSGRYKYHQKSLDFFKDLLLSLKKKHSQKQQDILELILQEEEELFPL